MSDKATIAAGRAAWAKLKKSRTFDDYLGRALLVGRRIAVAKARHRSAEGRQIHQLFFLVDEGERVQRHAAFAAQLRDADRRKREGRHRMARHVATDAPAMHLSAKFVGRISNHRAAAAVQAEVAQSPAYRRGDGLTGARRREARVA
jgi:hypothetical protein